jgi:hypothetical protein
VTAAVDARGLTASSRPAGPAGTRPSGPTGTRPPGQPGISAATPPRTDPREAWVRGFAMLFCEVEAGCRQRRQLWGLMSPLLFARLADCWVRGGPTGVVLRVHGMEVTPQVYEAVVVVRRGVRVGALAVRLVRRRGRWQVEDIARPEDGPLPPAPFPVGDDEDDDVLVDITDQTLRFDACPTLASSPPPPPPCMTREPSSVEARPSLTACASTA